MEQTTVHRPWGVSSGLSLLELLVVLTILIALGGIVVSTLPSMLKRTQVATAAANVPEIGASIRRSALISNGKIGNRFDSLVTGTTEIDGQVASYVGGADFFISTTLTPKNVLALATIGITELVPARIDAENATFAGHDQMPVTLSSSSKVCRIRDSIAATTLAEGWNLTPPTGSEYFVFGIGTRCSLVGGGAQAAFSETPIHFTDNSLQSPENMYSRYLVIVEINLGMARFVGVAIPGNEGIHSISRELENYYTSNSQHTQRDDNEKSNSQ